MKIPYLKIHNFLSIADAQLDLANQGLVGVFGVNHDAPGASSNGSGKSAIWDALAWCLYGRTFRELDYADDIVKLRSKGGCWVECDIIIDGQEWSIERYRNDPKQKNKLYLWKNDEDKSALTNDETQAKINKLLGMDFETFNVCVTFGQDSLRFAKATDREQKAILDRILGTEQYELAYKTAMKMKSGLDEDRRKLTENVRIAESVIENNKQIIENVKASRAKRIAELERTREKLVSTIAYLELAQSTAPQKTKDLEDKIAALKKEKDRLQGLVGKDHAPLIRSLKAEINTRMREIDRAKEAAEEATEDLEEIKASASLCKECKQTVNEQEYNKQLTFAEGKASGELDKWEKLVDESEAFYVEKQKEINRLEKEQAEFTKATSELAKVKGDLTRAESELAGHKDSMNMVNVQLAENRTRLDGVQTETDDSDKTIKACEEKISEHLATVATHNAETTELDALIKNLDFWIKGYGPGGIRSFIIDSMVPYLTERAQYYADFLLDGSIQIRFNTQKAIKTGELREKFEVQVVNSYGAEVYKGNSAGERQRIDFCVALALYDLARTRAKAPVELVVFDEAFERLDTAGCDRIIRLLKKESKNWKSCYVTTHSSDLATYFDRKLTITKEGGESRLMSQKGLPTNGKKNGKVLETKGSSMEQRY